MTSKQIWEMANDQQAFIREVYQSLCRQENINGVMTRLKQRVPCLIGADPDTHALVFQSTDDGVVALHIYLTKDALALALETHVGLE